MSDKSGVSDQVLSLPEGGGALHGIGEKFTVDLQTGTGNFHVPIELPPGRNGFQPQLGLQYNGGNGNGVFGFGWALSVPGVHRKTSRGVPRYDDTRDVFILSRSEDLVLVARDDAATTRYRPRTEGTFARISHHRDATTDHWEARTKDGLVNYYGTPNAIGDDPAVIAKPRDRTRIFQWRLTRTLDPFGNRIDHVYERDAVRVDGPHEWDQIYLTEIRYADYGDPANPSFLVRVRFIYDTRPDPSSEYRSGFEIRTTRRCRRIEISTNPGTETLARRIYLVYLDERPGAILPLNRGSLLTQMQIEGVEGTSSQLLPPLAFDYTRFDQSSRTFTVVDGPELPQASLSNPEYEHADLFARGLPDIVQINESGARYWKNLGNGAYDRPRTMKDAPAGLTLASPSVQLLDDNGDGRIDMMVDSEEMAGYYPLKWSGLWDRSSFRRYANAPTFDLEDPHVRLVDLDGDGVTDALRTGTRLECFFNDADLGWHETREVERGPLEDFPNVDFADPRVKLADMTGDGLQDIVFVHDGAIEYWPALGRGDWCRRVLMSNSPRLPWGYDPKRVLLGDVDGDGAADLVYVEDERVTLWINKSGNSFSDPIVIRGTPPVADMDGVRLVDLLGSGVRGIFWTRDFDGIHRDRYFFLDFTGGVKPYVLNQMDNHMGARTRVEYSPSTRFYIEDDQQLATKWKTSLPFPVQVVSRVETIDQISGGKLTTEYRYHHGYWDGVEHEFRGFGRVDQRDSESFERYHQNGLHGKLPFAAVDTKFYSPPTERRSWFHIGAVGDDKTDWTELDFSNEYWREDPPALPRRSALAKFLVELTRRDRRDAIRAMRGHVLRVELYSWDGSARANRPYSVTEGLPGVFEVVEDTGRPRLVDTPAPTTQKTRVFFPCSLANRDSQWERGEEPLTRITFTDYRDAAQVIDRYGRPRSTVVVGVPRGRDYKLLAPGPHEPFLATQTITEYAERDDTANYVVDRVARTTTYELVDDAPVGPDIFSFALSLGTKRVVGQRVMYYDGPALVGLPAGSVGDFGALVRKEDLVLSDALINQVYGATAAPYLSGGVPGAEYPVAFLNGLLPNAGYVVRSIPNDPNNRTGYYAATEQRRYDFQSGLATTRGLLLERRDALNQPTTLGYDGFDLLVANVTDAINHRTQAQCDYRVLRINQTTDPNGNVIQYGYGPLGFVDHVLTLGKPRDKADTPAAPSTRFEYRLDSFLTSGQPLSVRTVQRVYHALDDDPGIDPARKDDVVEKTEYSDGFGRLVQARALAEDVLFLTDENGQVVPQGSVGLPSTQGQDASTVGTTRAAGAPPRVVVSGWQSYDNKGRVVEKFEPYFSQSGWLFEPPLLSERGSRTEIYYDPRGQVIRKVNPDTSERRVVFGVPLTLGTPEEFTPTPWEAYAYDENDNAARTPLAPPAPIEHHDTPSSTVIDAFGRTVRAVERNAVFVSGSWTIEPLTSESTYDIRGNLLSSRDSSGQVAFQGIYDLAERARVLRAQTNDGGARLAAFDPAGDLIEQRTQRRAFSVRSYDPVHRLVRLWARDSANEQVTLRELLVYDDDGLPSPEARNLRGNLYRHYDEAGLLAFSSYDFKGNLVEKSRRVISDASLSGSFSPVPPQWNISALRANWDPLDESVLNTREYQTNFTYDALGRITRTQYPQGTSSRSIARTIYDRGGLPTQVSLDDQIFVDRIAHDAHGHRVLIAYGNGLITRYAYDRVSRRLLRACTEAFQQPAPLTYVPQGAPLQDFAYGYDTIGNVTAISERVPGCGVPAQPDALDRAFTYDAMYRLASATGRQTDFPPALPWDPTPRSTDINAAVAYSESYAYDRQGNLTRLSHSAAGATFVRQLDQFVPGTNRLQQATIGATTYPFAYDDDGNVLSDSVARQLEWDHCGRMRVFRNQAGSSEPTEYVQYLYDSSGQLVKKLRRTGGGAIETSIYIDGFEHYREGTQENFNVQVFDGHQAVATVRDGSPLPGEEIPSTVTAVYRLRDHLASSHVVLDIVGGFIRREEYTPYGETSFGSFGRARYRFTGKERNDESGFSYHGARYYAPWLGRWLSVDPGLLRSRNESVAGIRFRESRGGMRRRNGYSYADGNPISWIDPDGEAPIPLTTDRLRQVAAAQGIGSNLKGISLNREIGREFQTWVISNISNPFLLNVPETENFTKFGQGRLVQPDVVRSVTKVQIGGGEHWYEAIFPRIVNFPDSSFFEMKAVKGTISLSSNRYQIRAMIDALQNSPAGQEIGGHRPIPILSFITTGDTKIDPDVLTYATQRGVAIFQGNVFEIPEYLTSKPNDPALSIGPLVPLNTEVFGKQAIQFPHLEPSQPTHLRPGAPPGSPADPDPAEVQ